MLVWVAGFEPAASCVQGRPSTRLTVHPAKNNWCPRGESNSQNSASKADTYASSVTGAWITKKTNSPPFRLCPHAMGHARPARAPSTSLHREVAIPCTSRQAVHAALPWRWCEDTPEMVFLGRGHCAGVMSGKAPQQLVKEHRWPAARSPQALKTKRKGPEPCGARASAKRAWKGVRLCGAPSTRWPTILIVVMCTQISRQTRQQAQDRTRGHRSDAHERAARCGSAAGEGGDGVHGQFS